MVNKSSIGDKYCYLLNMHNLMYLHNRINNTYKCEKKFN